MKEYLYAYKKVLVRENSELIPAVFLGYEAGGAKEEIDQGIYLCRLPNGVERRFVECYPIATLADQQAAGYKPINS